MGDANHLAKFREGARAWNAWRAGHRGVTPDLREFTPHLGEKQLGPTHGGPIDLSNAILKGANLHSATLLEARLGNADLRQANLSMALLAGADLCFADLSQAILDNADLDKACLCGAILEGAKLDLARNLTQAQIEEAHGDASTTLPADLQIPAAWRAAEQSADEDLPLWDDADFVGYRPHEVLGVAPDASAEDIRAAYVKLAKKYHPDVRPGDLIAERRFKKINEAYHLMTAPPLARIEPPSRRRRASSWWAAMMMFVAALAAPTLALYLLGMAPFKVQPRQAERGEKSSDRLTQAPSEPAASAEADYTAALSAPAAETAAPGTPDPAFPQATAAVATELGQGDEAAPPEAEGEPIAMAAEVVAPTEPPLPDGASPPLTRSAALQPAPPTARDTVSAPWDEEWQALLGSSELTALHSFISRYREIPAPNSARGTVVAGVENVNELKTFVRGTVEDNPEKVLAKRQLALLVEREMTEGEQRAWDETRDRGTPAALRAYILGYPSGKHVAEAEERLSEIEEEAAERKRDAIAWAKALRSAAPAGYEAYLRAQPDGRHVEDAKKRIAALAAARTVLRKENEASQKTPKEGARAVWNGPERAPPDKVEQAPQAGPRRTASDTLRAPNGGGPRFPSPDEPFIERIQGTAQ
jgi:DnaJ domain/Pentapeptide repeats (8 copies)